MKYIKLLYIYNDNYQFYYQTVELETAVEFGCIGTVYTNYEIQYINEELLAIL